MSDDDFTKLYRNITKSTVWVGQPHHVKLAWVVMLAEADPVGRVTTPIPALAKLAEITVAEFEQALEVFMAPDKYSRSKELGGRRVVLLDDDDEYSGFRLVTHYKHRSGRDPEERRRQNREAQARYRAKNKAVSQADIGDSKNNVNELQPVSKEVSGVSRGEPIPSSSSSSSYSDPEGVQGEGPDPWGLTPTPDTPVEDDQQVFDHWLAAIWKKHNPRTARLTDQRRKRIRARLRHYSVADLCSVIDRAAASRFHMGQNDDGKFYGDIDNIMGSDEKVDKWLASNGKPVEREPQRLTGVAAARRLRETRNV